MVQNTAVAPELAKSANHTTSSSEDDTSTIPEDGDESTVLTAFGELLSDFLASNSDGSPQQVTTSVRILCTLIGNVSLGLPPNSPKRRVRLRNPKIREYVVEMEGAVDLLLQAGFERKVKDHEEWLVFSHSKLQSDADAAVENLESIHQELSLLLADLEANKSSATSQLRKRSTAVKRKKEQAAERRISLQRWKDEKDGGNDRIVNRNRMERRQQAELRQKQQAAQKWSDSMEPYLVPLCLIGLILMAWENPGKLFEYAIFAFVFYWMARLFASWCESGYLPFMGVRVN